MGEESFILRQLSFLLRYIMHLQIFELLIAPDKQRCRRSAIKIKKEFGDGRRINN